MGKTHSCKYFRLMADEYIEGELTEAEMREFEAHIAECEECRREVESIRALNAILRSNREAVPEGLHSRIMDAVKAEPKPKRKALILRRSALSAACFFICLSLTIMIAMLPMWNPSNAGGMELPEDPEYASGENQAASTEAVLKPEGTDAPADVAEKIEQEAVESAPESSAAASVPEASPNDTLEETMEIAEAVTPPAAEMTAAESLAPSTEAAPETIRPETEVPADEDIYVQTQADKLDYAPSSKAPSKLEAESSSSAPGGDEITLALLVVSGLLAVASFVAFLISLSSVRNTPHKKDKED